MKRFHDSLSCLHRWLETKVKVNGFLVEKSTISITPQGSFEQYFTPVSYPLFWNFEMKPKKTKNFYFNLNKILQKSLKALIYF